MSLQVQGHTAGGKVCVLPRLRPSHDYVLNPLGENIYNQAEGNSRDEEMDDEDEEAIYCNVTPVSRAFGAGAAEEFRPRHGPGPQSWRNGRSVEPGC